MGNCPSQSWTINAGLGSFLRKPRMEVEEQDENTKMSNKALAFKLLRGSGLTQAQRAQAFLNSGGSYDLDKLETMLRVTFGHIHEHERYNGQLVPQRRSTLSRPMTTSTRSSAPTVHSSKTSVGAPKPWARPALRESNGRFRNSRKTNIHEAEHEELEGDEYDEDGDYDEPEVDDEDYEDEEQEVYVGDFLDNVSTEHDVETFDEEDSCYPCEGELERSELQEAFESGWRARQKTANLRTRRGFVPPRVKHDGDKSNHSKQPPDPRKEESKCADCGEYGHWKRRSRMFPGEERKVKTVIDQRPRQNQSRNQMECMAQ